MHRGYAAAGAGGLIAAVVVLGLGSLPSSSSSSSSPPDFRPVSPDPNVIAARQAAIADRGPVSWALPTEHWLGEDGEQRQKARRKAWMADLHRAGDPELDYGAIEDANGLAQIAKRNRLAGMQAPPDGGPEWVERGSDNNAGRVHVALHSRDGQDLYVGSSRGGLWRRGLDGGDWEPLGDNLYGGAHWLTTYDGRGGPDVLLAATDGGLVHVSTDDGRTWERPTGLDPIQRVRRLLQAPDGSETTFMVIGNYQNRGWVHRVVRSRDRGQSWQVIREVGGFQPDLWMARDGSDDTLWMVADSVIYRSTDLGDSWQEEVALPASHNRAEIAGSEVGPRLWVVASGGSRQLYRYDVDVQAMSTISTGDANLGDYWGTLNASQVDPDLFAWGGVEVWRTFDGGESFDKINAWGQYYQDITRYLHADNPGMDVWMDGDEEVWYFSTDGGLFESRDGMRSVSNLSLDGLRISQYYDVLTSSIDDSHVAAGSQDQGYQTTQRLEEAQDGVYDLDQILSGDYAHLTSGDGSHGVVYSVYPGFMLVAVGEEDAQLMSVDFPEESEAGGIAWLPPIVADPTDPWSVFFCGKRLYRYTYDEEAGTWLYEDWADRPFVSDEREWLSALAFSPVDPDRAWLATNRGRIFFSDDHGRTWTAGTLPESLQPHYFHGHALIGSNLDADVAYLGGNGYQAEPIYRTEDGGRNWSTFREGMPNTQVYMFAQAGDGTGRLFAATQQAAYLAGEDGVWRDITGVDAPVTTYWSVEWLERGVARFGTYGRGIWDYDFDPDGDGCWEGVDRDEDGFDCLEDCADDDPEVFPGAVEACDGVDVNCDPSDVLEDDADNDGFLACEECDDASATVFPGAEEIRGNDIDEDCDGEDLKRRCGCSSASVGGTALWLALVPLLWRRRRG